MAPVDPDTLYGQHLAEMMRRADRALKAAHADALVLAAGFPVLQYRDDQYYPHKAAAHFLSFVPLPDAPGSFVVHRPDQRPLLLFFQPEDYWHAPPRLPEASWLGAFEVIVLRDPKDAKLHIPLGAAYVGPPVSWLEGRVLQNPDPLIAVLDYARAAKTPYELACLRHASALAARGHRAAREAWHAGESEYGIHLAYLAATGHEDAELPYHNIVATNESAAVLHYTVRDRREATARRSFLIDAGAQCRGYAADVTRTYAAGDGAFAELIVAMEKLELDLCAQVSPGRPYPEIHEAAHAGVAHVLVDAGIVKCSVQAALATGLTQVFFPHGVGHLLGLQVHDVGGWQLDESGKVAPRPQAHPFLRLGRVLGEGFVVTIEPGLYFIPLLLNAARADGRGRDIDWETVEKLAPYGGIRIEDNVVAGAGGPHNLTRDAWRAASGN